MRTRRRQRDKLLENRNGQAGVSWSEHARDTWTETPNGQTDTQTDRRARVAQPHAQGPQSVCGATSHCAQHPHGGRLTLGSSAGGDSSEVRASLPISAAGIRDQRWRSEVVAKWPQTRTETRSVGRGGGSSKRWLSI